MYEDLYVAREGATFDLDGQPVFINAGDIARSGHPVLNGHQYLFEPLVIKWDVPRPVAKVSEPVKEPEPAPEAKTVLHRAPANPVKASQQGARSRSS